MIIFTRELMEALVIGDAVRVRVLEVDGNKISVGIDAPKDVVVRAVERADYLYLKQLKRKSSSK